MSGDSDSSRRSFLRRSSLAVTCFGALPAAAAANAGQNGRDRASGRVIYADEHGRIVKVSSHGYAIRGARSKGDYDYLREKQRQLLSDDGDVSAQSHTDEGLDTEDGTYDGRSWSVETDFWAHAKNGYGEVEGTASAGWWGEAYWHDEPLGAEITITSRIVASYDGDSHSVTVSVPPAYTYSIGSSRIEVTLSDTWQDENHPSLHHDKGAVTFDIGSGCFNWIRQDDRFKYAYETGDTHYYGTDVKANVGHCLV